MNRGIIIGGLYLAAACLAAPAQAGGGACLVFFDKPGFEDFCLQDGKLIKGIEDFEPPIGNVPAGGIAGILVDPLQGNVPNVDAAGLGFPNGLLNKNLIIQSNVLGTNAPDPAPGGGLAAVGAGAIIPPDVPNSIVVGANWFDHSTDLIFDPTENHTGIGFDVLDPFNLFEVHIAVFNKANVEIAKEIIPVTDQKTFFGIWCPETIGRINIAAVDQTGAGSAELVDNIQMWMEVPQEPVCPWDCAIPHDKMISIVDFLALLATWGQVGVPCDFDGGGVGITDFLKMLARWGPCPTPLNDKCQDALKVDAFSDGTIEEHFDMYGATADPWQYKCLTGPPIHKDTWYCLNNNAPDAKGVIVRTNVPLFVEVNAGCECPPGALVACGDGLVGTEQFIMQPGEQVLIRLIDWLDLPNEELKGSVFFDIKPGGGEPVNFFEDPFLFDLEVIAQGKFTKGIWNFKEDHLLPGEWRNLDDILDINTHPINAPGVWDDGVVNLWPPEIDNVQFSSNLNPQGPFVPHGLTGLWYGKPGAVPELTNNALVANWFIDSFDIISGPPAGDNHTAMGLELIGLDVDGIPDIVNFHISVYDKNDVEIGKHVITAIQGEKPFLGIITKDPAITIGRVDIWDELGFAEGISAIALYTQVQPSNDCDFPSPCPVPQCAVGVPQNCHCFEVDFDPNVGMCIQDFFCADVQPCPAGGCPPGFVCVTNSCCGPEFCVPIIKCDDNPPGVAAPTSDSGLTGSGQYFDPAK
jgi:hypothetical protein